MGIRRKANVASVVVWRYIKSLTSVAAFLFAFLLMFIAALTVGAGILGLFWRGIKVYLFGWEVHYDSPYDYYDHSTIDGCFGTDVFVGFMIVLAVLLLGWGLKCLFMKVKTDAKQVSEEIELRENPHLFAAQEKGQLSLPFDGSHALSLADGGGELSLAQEPDIVTMARVGNGALS